MNGCRPSIGDVVAFGRNECVIVVEEVATDQPLAAHGIYAFTDQYGERHLCEGVEGDDETTFEIVTPDQLRSLGLADDAAT